MYENEKLIKLLIAQIILIMKVELHKLRYLHKSFY